MNIPRFHSHLSRRSLLLVTLGLFLLSLVSAYYFKVQPSGNYQQKMLQHYVQQEEEDARRLLRDSMLLRKLIIWIRTSKAH